MERSLGKLGLKNAVNRKQLRVALVDITDLTHPRVAAVNGGVWVGKDYGQTPAWKRDPLHNLSHGATAMQTARFYYLLETKELVSAKLCRKMKQILSRPELRHKFVKGLEARPGSRIYRKSGSWKRCHADSAIAEHFYS